CFGNPRRRKIKTPMENLGLQGEETSGISAAAADLRHETPALNSNHLQASGGEAVGVASGEAR
ncbi:hypothetical protein U1Q18_035607, partial [Sarracenia purpurea var. burkii]